MPYCQRQSCICRSYQDRGSIVLAGSNFLEDIQQFLGLANYYNQVICDFPKLAAPLTALLAKNTLWNFGKRELCTFESLEKALCNYTSSSAFGPPI